MLNFFCFFIVNNLRVYWVKEIKKENILSVKFLVLIFDIVVRNEKCN